VPAERRTEADIRQEITTERQELVDALADLRKDIDAKRRPAAIVGGAVAAGLATLAVAKVFRRFRDG
jgi:hypothetical protein